jgi:hypothetical protein
MEYGCDKPKNFLIKPGDLADQVWDELAPILTENRILQRIHQPHFAITCQLIAENRQAMMDGNQLPNSQIRVMRSYMRDWGLAGPTSRWRG